MLPVLLPKGMNLSCAQVIGRLDRDHMHHISARCMSLWKHGDLVVPQRVPTSVAVAFRAMVAFSTMLHLQLGCTLKCVPSRDVRYRQAFIRLGETLAWWLGCRHHELNTLNVSWLGEEVVMVRL